MKIRLDYVSNSSSSSFFIMGRCFSDDEVIDALVKKGKDPDELDICEIIDDMVFEKEFGLDVVNDGENEQVFLGLTFDSMKDDETKAEFTKRAKEQLSKFFDKDLKVEPIVEEIYC